MNENLAQMLKEETPDDTNQPEQNTIELEEESQLPSPDGNSIVEIVPFSEWFERHNSRFENINQVKIAIRGVDSENTIIITVPDPKNEKDESGNLKRKLRIFEDSNQIPVINLVPSSMDIYNNGFRIVYDFNERVSIKCYGVKTGLISVLCNNIDDQMVPYEIIKVKKKDKDMEIKIIDVSDVKQKLLQPADKENIQILYKQVIKFISGINTNQDAVNWFLTRQSEVMDVNHHLQIDEVLCYILK